MKLHFKAAWGIELGASSVNAVKLAVSKAGPRLVAAHAFKHETPIEKDEDFHQKSLQGLMRLMVEGGLKKSDPIVVSAPGRAIFSRPIELPAMDPKRIPELIKYEASQQIPYPIDEVVWNYHIGQADPGAEIKATIFAIRREEVDALLNIFKEAGLSVRGIQTTPLALLNYVRFDLAPEAPCVIIDVKSRNIDFIISHGADFWQRNITRCGDDINKALMAKFKIPFGQAEDLKRNMSSNQQADKILQVIEPVFKQMVSEILRTIGHYKSQHEGVQLHDAILMGQSFRMAKMAEYFQQNLRMKIHIPSKLHKLEGQVEEGKETLDAEYNAFTVPIGLALQGIGAASIHVNLIPPEIEQRREQMRKAPYALAASVIFAVSGGLYWQTVSAAEEKLKSLMAGANSPQALKQKYEGVSTRIAEADAELAPALAQLEQWKVLERDPYTQCTRGAHAAILDSLGKALSNEGIPDKDMVYIESLRIMEEATPPALSGRATGSKVHKVLLEGTFFSHGTSPSSNFSFLNTRIVQPLNALKGLFEGFKYITCEPAINDLGSELQRFKVEGYYVPVTPAAPPAPEPEAHE